MSITSFNKGTNPPESAIGTPRSTVNLINLKELNIKTPFNLTKASSNKEELPKTGFKSRNKKLSGYQTSSELGNYTCIT